MGDHSKTNLTVIIFVIIYFSLGDTFFAQTNGNINSFNSKVGGVCFRVDDVQSKEHWSQFASIFNKYGYHVCYAINPTRLLGDASGVIDTLRRIQSEGHEIMDHTPNHQTHYFTNVTDPTLYIGQTGVDHVSGDTICLKWGSVTTTTYTGEGLINVFGNLVISLSAGEFSNIDGSTIYMIYIPSINQIFRVSNIRNKNKNDVDTLTIRSFWDERVNLGNLSSINYEKIGRYDVSMDDDAILLLAERSRNLFNQFGLNYPVTWIQPGGNTPLVSRNQLKRTLGTQIGYLAGASSYATRALKCYNEYNPEQDKQFGMGWADFRDDIWDLNQIKQVIADEIARHYLAINMSHFENYADGLLGGWDGYVQRVDSVLMWCKENNIPVFTYTEWSNILYRSEQDSSVNIFPKLNVDLDKNGVPDGIYNVPGYTDGIFDTTDGVAESGNRCYKINTNKSLCYVSWLGGLEKGENEFSIWTKGSPGSEITVYISFDDVPLSTIQMTFPASTSEWVKYDASQSLNQTKSLFIPENANAIDVRIKCTNYKGGWVKVSGMSIRKKMNLTGPVFSVYPDRLLFGNVNLFYSKQESVIVKNTGIGSLNITSVNSTSADFSVAPNNAVISSGDSQIFYITFNPTSGGIKNGLIVFNHNVGNFYDTVFVNGIAQYSITAMADINGNIMPSGIVNVNLGADTTFIITPNIGYHIDNVFVDGIYVGIVPSYTFTNVTSNHSIRATFRISTYKITSIAGSNGRINPAGIVNVYYGDNQTYTITPDIHYHIDSVLVDGLKVDSTTSYTFSNITSDHTITAKFAIDTYNINATSTEGGTIVPAGNVTVAYGSSQRFTIMPFTGYYLDTLFVDDVHVDSSTSYTFENITNNHTIYSKFNNYKFEIIATAEDGGSIIPNGVITIGYGRDQIFKFIPEIGHHVDSVFIDGVYIGNMDDYTFTNVIENHIIRVIFAIDRYNLTIGTIGKGNIIKVPDLPEYDYHTRVELTAVPEFGWHFSGWNGAVRTEENPIVVDVDSNMLLDAKFDINIYNIKATSSKGGNIEPSGDIAVPHGSNQKFNIIPSVGFYLDSLYVDDVHVDSLTSYTFYNVMGNHTIESKFRGYTYTILALSGEGGEIVPSGPITVNYGDNVMFSFYPRFGYHVDSVFVDNMYIGKMDNYTFTDIDGNHTIRVNFGLNKYTITTTVFGNGSIYPETVIINHGGDQIFHITPYDGWHIDSVLIDGVSFGDISTYEFNNVTSDHYVIAYFSKNGYKLTINSINGIVIKDPDSSVYSSNTFVKLTAVPDHGYNFSSWGGDTNGNSNPIVILMDGNKTIIANFEIQHFTLAVSGEHGTFIKNPDQPTYEYGTVVQVSAIADTGYHFVGWDGDTSGNTNPISLVMNNNKIIKGIFEINTYLLTINATNGAVLKIPDKLYYESGSIIQITAVPNNGFHFVNWSGDLNSTKNPDTILMNTNKTITANFELNTYSISTSIIGKGTIIKNPDKPLYYYGESLTLTATPDFGYKFQEWGGDLSGTTNPITLIVDNNKTLVAVFVLRENAELSLRDNFNTTATKSINGRYKWKQLTNNDPGSGSIQINGDSTISPYNRKVNKWGGVVWDSLLTDGTRLGLIFKGPKGNSARFSIYFRMNGKDLATSDGYMLSYNDEPAGVDRIMLEMVRDGTNYTTLSTLYRELSIGDTLVVKVESDKTMKALVYGINKTRDSISVVNNTYNSSQWYCWIRGLAVKVPVKFDDFMIGYPILNGSTSLKEMYLEENNFTTEFSLEKAYPNPFNPSTQINYYIPVESKVKLTIYNLLGQIVTVLLDDVQVKGNYSVLWNAFNISGGVYFYCLEAISTQNQDISFKQVKKMVLVK